MLWSTLIFILLPALKPYYDAKQVPVYNFFGNFLPFVFIIEESVVWEGKLGGGCDQDRTHVRLEP